MRNLSYLLTGTFLFTFIIVGCKKNNPSPQQPHTKKWESQLNKNALISSTHIDESTVLKYESDIFNFEKPMKTPGSSPSLILISSNNLTDDAVNILILTSYNEEDVDKERTSALIGQVKTVTNTNVIQEISDFINGNEEDIILDSYTEIENSTEKSSFRISFYKASYTIKDFPSLPSSLRRAFVYRQDQAYMMISDTTTPGQQRQVDVSISLLFDPINPHILYQEPIDISFQQYYEDFSTTSDNLTALMKGLNITGFDPFEMTMNKVIEPQSVRIIFNQVLDIEGKEIELQIEVESNMEPLHFNTLNPDKMKEAILNLLADAGKAFIEFSSTKDEDKKEASSSFSRIYDAGGVLIP